jgi:hypothetical protein
MITTAAAAAAAAAAGAAAAAAAAAAHLTVRSSANGAFHMCVLFMSIS